MLLTVAVPGMRSLEITAPSSVVSGQPFNATVTAMYNGKRDTILDGPVHFTTSDNAANLPTLYVFTAQPAAGEVVVTKKTIHNSGWKSTPIMIIVRLLSPEPVGWFCHLQL